MSTTGNPSARLLRLLGLLQSRPRWSGAELAELLGVGPRTLRYDVSKLRDLGYRVDAVPGVAGGYALGAGSTLPPLLLDDEEAVTIAIGLRLAATGGGRGEAAATALAKLEQVLPWRLRGRFGTLSQFTDAVGEPQRPTDPDDIAFLTEACRDRRRVRFRYTARDGQVAPRDVEPYRVVQMSGAWHLLAFDLTRDDWRQFRLDRMAVDRPAGARFRARTAPTSDTMLASVDELYRRHRADVLVAAPTEIVTARVPAVVPVERVDDEHCRVRATGDTPFGLAVNLLLLDQPFIVEDTSPEVCAALRTLRDRLTASLVPFESEPRHGGSAPASSVP